MEGLSRRRRTGQGLAQRARIVLLAAEGLENKAIAHRTGAVENTVGKWRRRFAEKRVDGLLDEARSGRPREIGDDEIAETVRQTLEATPRGSTHWSLRAMAEGRRPCALDHPSHLESLRPSAAPHGELQAVERSPVRREGAEWAIKNGCRGNL
ncbi:MULTISPECIES: helix-turn-helix domain-containing protein [unclassified Bradyrhizobium]|uniref:helix-turn-helix domain-containing protein n=1 Tax=unclassified Bradyrhizobium TaxID=2631580 RepID=UPI0028EA71FB|nr:MULTISPECIES: helix-turn-helix domain-containing protein [unclassified Bradyrhizobium]